MKNIRVNWRQVRGIAAATTVGAGALTVVGGVLSMMFLMADSDHSRQQIREAVEESETLTPEAGRIVRLVDYNTVQVTQGVLHQTFSFALNRVITSGDYGNGQQFQETTDFSAYSDPAAIERARSEGCTLAAAMESAMENYDFGMRATNTEKTLRQETMDLAALYTSKHCPVAP